MSNQLADGTGMMEICYDSEKKKIILDLSGNDRRDGCYRNDASILFFASNSYRSSYICIGNELNKRFENNQIKHIHHLILPYLFNFRHFLELELKGLYVAITNESPTPTHNLDTLLKSVGTAITNLEFGQNDYIHIDLSIEEFNLLHPEIKTIYNDLKSLITKYSQNEPAVEYYRYVFEINNKQLKLNNPVIEFDFYEINELFLEIRNTIDKLRSKLKEVIFLMCTF